MSEKEFLTVVNISECMNFMSEIRELSDRNKKFLGMLPYSAMDQHASRGEILVAKVGESFAGYLLFRAVPSFRRLSVTHLCIEERYRGNSCTKKLLDELKNKCREQQYSGIALNCRQDYESAKRVWENNNFFPASEKQGRGKGEYQVVTWWWANNSAPSLFDAYVGNPEKLNGVIDVNTLINLKENNPQTELLSSDWLIDEIELSVTKETFIELQRHEDHKVRINSKTYAAQFPMVEVDERSFKARLHLLTELMPEAKTPQDTSDRRQLAYALSGDIDAFITSDERLLESATVVREKLGLNIFRPEEFILYIDEILNESMYRPARLAGTVITTNKLTALDFPKAIDHFRHHHERKLIFSKLLRELASDVHNIEVNLIRNDTDELMALFSISGNVGGSCIVNILRINAGALTFTLTAQILDLIVKIGLDMKVEEIRLIDKYSDINPELLEAFGFYTFDEEQIKFYGCTINNLNQLQDTLKRKISAIDENHIAIKELNSKTFITQEKSLWPSKALDIEVPIYVIPIQPHWAMELFDVEISSEDLFGSKPELAFNYENAYYTASRQTIEAPGRIVWYVSGGSTNHRSSLSGHIRAISYLDEAVTGTPKELYRKYRRLGVFSWKDILEKAGGNMEQKLQALLFSRTEILDTPLSLKDFNELQSRHGLAKNNLPGPLKISPLLFESIYKGL